jgi:GNAT superfamily N-acetyltransferase
VTVRRIRDHEWVVLREVRLAALDESPDAFSSTLEREAVYPDDVWRERAAASAAGESQVTFFAELDGAVVGLVTGLGGDSGGVVELVGMWVAPSARHARLGAGLVGAITEWAAAKGRPAVELWVMRGNEPAQRLYESCGFAVITDHDAQHFDPCKDEVRMRRPS